MRQEDKGTKLNVIVPVTPRMSNHNDIDALQLHPEINFQFVYASELNKTDLPAADLIILGGSKNTRADLAFIAEQGWDKQIARHIRYGGKVFGICGGYQMLGSLIIDKYGVEGEAGESKGLGFLPMTTDLAKEKTLKNCTGKLNLAGGNVDVSGYEIHMGESAATDSIDTILTIGNQAQGMLNDDGNVAGCYLHGIFDNDQAIQELASWCETTLSEHHDLAEIQEQAIDKLADVCRDHLDMKQLTHLIAQWGN